MKLEKCSFVVGKRDYPGHVTRLRRKGIVKDTTKTIRALQSTLTFTEICWFLGLGNVFRRVIPNSGWIAAKLSNELEMNQPKHIVALTSKEQCGLRIQHKGRCQRRQYTVRWHENALEDGTLEPARNIPQRFNKK